MQFLNTKSNGVLTNNFCCFTSVFALSVDYKIRVFTMKNFRKLWWKFHISFNCTFIEFTLYRNILVWNFRVLRGKTRYLGTIKVIQYYLDSNNHWYQTWSSSKSMLTVSRCSRNWKFIIITFTWWRHTQACTST